jgi:hypothetical protein
MGVNAAYAALFEPAALQLDLEHLPSSHREAPDYLNVLRICDIPDVLKIVTAAASGQPGR